MCQVGVQRFSRIFNNAYIFEIDAPASDTPCGRSVARQAMAVATVEVLRARGHDALANVRPESMRAWYSSWSSHQSPRKRWLAAKLEASRAYFMGT